MLRVRRHESQLESIYKCVLCYDPESLWKTLSVRVKVVVMVRVRAGMDGWGLWSKCFLPSPAAFNWIQLRTQSVSKGHGRVPVALL